MMLFPRLFKPWSVHYGHVVVFAEHGNVYLKLKTNCLRLVTGYQFHALIGRH